MRERYVSYSYDTHCAPHGQACCLFALDRTDHLPTFSSLFYQNFRILSSLKEEGKKKKKGGDTGWWHQVSGCDFSSSNIKPAASCLSGNNARGLDRVAQPRSSNSSTYRYGIYSQNTLFISARFWTAYFTSQRISSDGNGSIMLMSYFCFVLYVKYRQ